MAKKDLVTENVTESVVTEILEKEIKESVKTSKLTEPLKRVLMGEIEAINFKPANFDAGGKFEKDTYIVSVSVPTVDSYGNVEFKQEVVFLTASQYKEYGMKDILYKGNYIKLVIEDCIANKTGYKDNIEDDYLTAHQKTFSAFANATEATITSLYISLTKLGLPKDIVDSIVSMVNQIRETQKVIVGGVAKPF